jgi:predicted CDP-diglyceride synthetase/phosphatidate cytidylyltransferase
MKEHLKGLISIFEGKTSIIVLLAIAFSVIAMWQAIRFRTIDTNLMVIVLSLVGTVAGVNVSAVMQKTNISDIGNVIGTVGSIAQETTTAVQSSPAGVASPATPGMVSQLP